MENKKSLTKNSVFYLFYNALNIIFPFLTGVYAARVLLQTNIGQIESARNFAQYFVVLAFLGIPTYGLREVAKARDNRRNLSKVYSELMVINGISTIAFSLIYYSLVIFIPFYRNNLILYIITGFSIILNMIHNPWLYEGLEDFKFISLRNLLFKIVTFLLLIILVRKQSDYMWYAIISVIGLAGNEIFNILRAKKYVDFSLKELDLLRHLKPILLLVVVNLAIEIYTLVDVTMLTFMCDEKTVAIYSYGMKIYKIFIQIINTFTIVLIPRLAIFYKDKRFIEFNNLLTKALKIIIILAVPTIVGVWFVSDYVISAIYGISYLRSAIVLNALCIILIISPIGYLLGSRVLLISGNENKMMLPVVCGAITNIIFNLALIPFYREIGAAIASILGEIVVMAVYILLSHKHFKIQNISKTIMRVIISTVFMAIFLCGISKIHIYRLYISIIQIATGVFAYFAILLVLNENIVQDYLDVIIGKIRKATDGKQRINP